MALFRYQFKAEGDPAGMRQLACGIELVDGSEEARLLDLVAEEAAGMLNDQLEAAGWKANWPVTLSVYDVSGKKLFTSKVHRHMKPVFVASTVERCVPFRKPGGEE